MDIDDALLLCMWFAFLGVICAVAFGKPHDD